ncbi:MAG: hypothetical protein O2924_01555 [Chloroflexi bacterium]|nr:hypothetical protein [Chloroflexota bacterium]MQC47702.1 hypothetical protein [Chloroflexota bacterium]
MTAADEDILEQRDRSRSAVVRRAAIYVPLAVLLVGLLLMSLPHLPGSIIVVIVLTLSGAATSVEAYQSVADLFAKKPVMSRGVLDRKWSKARFMFFGRIHYLLVDGRIVHDGAVDRDIASKLQLFEVGPVAEMELARGDELEVVHWPHTNEIVTLRRIGRAADHDRPSPR